MFKLSAQKTLLLLLAVLSIGLCCVIDAQAQAPAARCRRSGQVKFVFPANSYGAVSLTAMAFTGHPDEKLSVQVEQPLLEKMDRDEHGCRVANLDVNQRTEKLYFLFLDDHGILVGIRAIAGLELEEVNGDYTIPYEKSYEVSLPRVCVDKTSITAGEIVTATVVCEDGYIKLFARSGNTGILAPCQRPLSEVFTKNEFCYTGVKAGQNVIQVVMHNGGNEIYCTNSDVITVK